MMTKPAICWLVPDDLGGGVVSMAEACCRHATTNFDPTLLLLLTPVGHVAEYANFRIDSVNATPPYGRSPAQIVDWVKENRPDILFLNSCEQADVALPHIPQDTRIVYMLHDTARRYYAAALEHEAQIDSIVAVSEVVARKVRSSLKNPAKLSVIHNGAIFPKALEDVLAAPRSDDLIFLGGDVPTKGAYDVLALWPELVKRGFAGRIHWFGGLTDAFRAEVAAVTGPGRFVLHGRAHRSAIFETAMGCKILLMLSRVEPFGMVTVETMGMGCTPVAWDIETGTTEIVAEGEGVFVPLGDYGAMAAGIVTACKQHSEVFARSTIRVRDTFSEAVMGEKYEALMTELLSQPVAYRRLAGQAPPRFNQKLRLFQILPKPMREAVRRMVGRSAVFGHWLRDMRGI